MRYRYAVIRIDGPKYGTVLSRHTSVIKALVASPRDVQVTLRELRVPVAPGESIVYTDLRRLTGGDA